MKHYVLKYLHRYFIEAEFFLIISSLFYNYLGSYQRSGLFLRMKHMFIDNFEYISTLLSISIHDKGEDEWLIIEKFKSDVWAYISFFV